MDYGKPAAQFVEADVDRKAGEHVGEKITVKGTVAKVEIDESGDSWIYLASGARCNLGKFKAMAESAEVGTTVYVDGFLKKCAPGDVLIEPAMLRDPTAPFSAE
jgi:hypothetical protein